MKIIKRSGEEVTFDASKIEAAIIKANNSVAETERMRPLTIHLIVNAVTEECSLMDRAPSVEEIQDMVENHIMEQNAFNVARNYITYRYRRAVARKANSTDKQILSLLDCSNEEAKQENTQSTGVETGVAIVYDEQSDENDGSVEKVDIVYPTEMPNGIYTFNGHSYGFYDAKDYDLTTYSAVSNFCREQGGHLAVINNQAENDYLYNLMTSLYDHTVFFGYSDENKEGNWQWDGDDSTYENWTQWGDWDLPDNGRDWGGNEDYAEFNYDTIHDWSPRDGTWNDAPFMDNTSIFICEWEYEFN